MAALRRYAAEAAVGCGLLSLAGVGAPLPLADAALGAGLVALGVAIHGARKRRREGDEIEAARRQLQRKLAEASKKDIVERVRQLELRLAEVEEAKKENLRPLEGRRPPSLPPPTPTPSETQAARQEASQEEPDPQPCQPQESVRSGSGRVRPESRSRKLAPVIIEDDEEPQKERQGAAQTPLKGSAPCSPGATSDGSHCDEDIEHQGARPCRVSAQPEGSPASSRPSSPAASPRAAATPRGGAQAGSSMCTVMEELEHCLPPGWVAEADERNGRWLLKGGSRRISRSWLRHGYSDSAEAALSEAWSAHVAAAGEDCGLRRKRRRIVLK